MENSRQLLQLLKFYHLHWLLVLVYSIFRGDILLSSAPLEGYATSGIAALIAGIAATTWSYDGMGAACYMSGEIKNPKKNMPLGLILTAVIVLALYAGLTFVASGILSIDEMATSDAPIALLASKLPGIGHYAGTIVAIMAIIVVIWFIIILYYVPPRIEYAMAKDNLFFKSLQSSSKIRNSLFFNYRTVCGCNRINFCFRLVSIARILYNGSIIKECAYIRYNLCASKKRQRTWIQSIL